MLSSTTQTPVQLPLNTALWAGLVLFILHLVGFVGLNLPQTQALFLKLVPLNLIITTFLLLFFRAEKYSKSFWVFVWVIFISGIAVEIAGVHTGKVFGSYNYGAVLGPKIAEVPWLIGLNWLMLVYATGTLANRLPVPDVVKCLFAAFLMTLLDYLIEPVAIQFDFWQWKNNLVPFQNYAAWFVVSGIMQAFFFTLPFQKNNPLAIWVYGVQVLFFAANIAVLYF